MPAPTPTPPPVTIDCSTIHPVSVMAGSGAASIAHRLMTGTAHGSRPQFVSGAVEVLYHNASNVHAFVHALPRTVASDAQDLAFDRTEMSATVLHVTPGTEAATIAKLRTQPGVVAATQPRHVYLTTAAQYDPNDTYFDRNQTPPFYQDPTQYGQWDMHVIGVDYAWGYSQPGATVVNPGALGGNSTIAVIDTGVDPAHPDISPKLTSYYAIYDHGNGTASASNVPMHDCDGHGTNVAGIAAANPNDGFGFAGAGYSAKIMPFKVFPDAPSGSQDSAASASSIDVAAAINDAVAHNVQVISMSLGADPSGGSTCANGGEDPTQGAAVQNALNHGIIVVAAAGNGNSSSDTTGIPVLSCPGGDPGVIAVGASGLDDTNPANIKEVVASYSDWDPSNAQWGLVAPGGTATDGSDPDYYHWIVNDYSSIVDPLYCQTDVAGASNDCREALVGTSQATPHVAGVAAIMESAIPNISPASMKSILCATSDPINATPIKYGCGRLNAYRAMARLLNDPTVQSTRRKL